MPVLETCSIMGVLWALNQQLLLTNKKFYRAMTGVETE